MQADQLKKLQELYIHYLMVSIGQVSSTNLSEVLDKEISNDSFTRMLLSGEFTSSDLWKFAKKSVREIESEQGILIIDDHIEEKPYMDDNDLISWHYDHTSGRSVKGINQLSMIYQSKDSSFPVGFRFIHKTENILDKKTNKEKCVSSINKNEHYRNLLKESRLHQIKYKYVLNDNWFCSVENIIFIQTELKKYFIMAIKSNRNVAISETNKKKGIYQKLETLDFSDNKPKEIWLEGVKFPLLITKQVFKNKDDSTGQIYLITNDLTLDHTQICEIYQKRWKVEEHHKTIKSNLNYGKSPAKNAKTQQNHCFLVLCASVQWENLSKNIGLNHFALKAKLYLKAIKSAWNELVILKNKFIITNTFA